jgi:hypothetical protein
VLCLEAAVWRWQHSRGGRPRAVVEEGHRRRQGITVVCGFGGGASASSVEDGHVWG